MKITQYGDNIAQQNSYLLTSLTDCIIIDPGFNGASIIKDIKDKNLHLLAVLLTHGHFDHIRDIRLIQDVFNVTLYIHELDQGFLANEALNGARHFGANFVIKKTQEVKTFKDEDHLTFNDMTLEVWHTPGHTKGSSCFLIQNALFSGDTLFADSIGRSDLETGNLLQLRHSLAKLATHVANDTWVFPGHQEKAKMSDIKKSNILFQKYAK